jgi:hypothetical protein
LKFALKRKVDFFLVGEDSNDRRLHLHGVVAATEEEAPIVRAALRRAAGEWSRTRQHQAHAQPLQDDGWATYLGKGAIKHSQLLRERYTSGTKWAATVAGSWIAATNALRTCAGGLYEVHRSAYLHKSRLT